MVSRSGMETGSTAVMEICEEVCGERAIYLGRRKMTNAIAAPDRRAHRVTNRTLRGAA
jgi:hypothetical protein